MNKQTALDWFVSQLPIRTLNAYHEEIVKALAMEREQIELAYDEGSESEYQYHINGGDRKDASTYINEIYGGEQ